MGWWDAAWGLLFRELDQAKKGSVGAGGDSRESDGGSRGLSVNRTENEGQGMC
jgi:hypothetical protein